MYEEALRPYCIRREELSVHVGCLLWGARVIVATQERDRCWTYYIFSRCFALLGKCYRSGYDLFCVQISVFPWACYVGLFSCFTGVLAYQVHDFLPHGIGLSLALVVGSSRLFISGVFFFLFLRFRSCFVTLARCVALGRGYLPSIFLFGIYTRCVWSRGRVLSPGLFTEYLYALCGHGGKIRRVYSYTEYLHVVCSHEGESSNQE